MKTESRLLFPWHPSVGSMSTHHAPKEQLSKPAVVKTASNSGILTSTSSTPNRSTTDPGPGGQGHYARTQPRAEGTSSRTPSKHDARPSSSSASKLRLSSSSSSNHGQSSHHQQSTSSSHHSSSNQRSNHSSSHQHHERGNHSHQHSDSDRRKQSPGTPELDSKASNNEAPLECDWSEHISSSGKPYYFNRKEGSSQWLMPSAFAQYRAEKERRQKLKAAYAQDRRKSDHRSSRQHASSGSSQVQDVSPPSSSTGERTLQHSLSVVSRASHRTSTSSTGVHADSKSRTTSRSESSQSVPSTPVTPVVRQPMHVQVTSADNGKSADGVGGGSTILQPSLASQTTLHPLLQATLLLQAEQSRKAAAVVRSGLHNHTVPSPKLACVEYRRMYCDEHGRPRRPRPDCLVQPISIPSAPQLEDSLVADFSSAAIAHLQGWSTEAVESDAHRAHSKWHTVSFCQEPVIREEIHQAESICRSLSVASEVATGHVLAIQGHVAHLEKSLGLDSNPS